MRRKSDDGLRPLFRRNVRLDWQSIETGVGRGVPDSSFCGDGVEGWIEFKSTRVGALSKFRPEQVGWILRRVRHGGRVFIAVRRRTIPGPRRGPGVDELWLFWGGAAKELKRSGLTPLLGPRGTGPDPHSDRVALAAALRGMWQGGPERWSWDLVRAAMLKPVA